MAMRRRDRETPSVFELVLLALFAFSLTTSAFLAVYHLISKLV
jgi:hypothetical protein